MSTVLTLIICYSAFTLTCQAIPIESEANVTIQADSLVDNVNEDNKNDTVNNNNTSDLDSAATEDKAATADYDENIDTLAESSNNQNSDGSILDAFHQYVNGYGNGPYAPFPAIAPYPAPTQVGYGAVPVPVPAIYPSPYAVQTAYEGYLVPTTTASTTSTTTTAATTTSNNPLTNFLTFLNPLTFFTTTLPVLMMSTIFRVLAAAVSIIGMFFFSGAFGNLICNFTPICDMAYNTVTLFMRRGGAADNVGRLFSGELTPERLMEAEKFVRRAIRNYRDLQKAAEQPPK